MATTTTKAKYFDPLVLSYLDQAEEAKAKRDYLAAVRFAEKAYAHDTTCGDALEEVADNYISLEEYTKAQKAAEYALFLAPDSANAYFLLGFLQIKYGDYEQAITYLTKADGLVANHPEVLRNLGWAYYNSKQHTRGLLLLERALNILPNDTYIMCDLGICYINEKNFEKAIALFERALAVEPENEKFIECIKTAEYFKKEFAKYTK